MEKYLINNYNKGCETSLCNDTMAFVFVVYLNLITVSNLEIFQLVWICCEILLIIRPPHYNLVISHN